MLTKGTLFDILQSKKDLKPFIVQEHTTSPDEWIIYPLNKRECLEQKSDWDVGKVGKTDSDWLRKEHEVIDYFEEYTCSCDRWNYDVLMKKKCPHE
jgi:hypothetical protein